jgi:hypothetical protein
VSAELDTRVRLHIYRTFVDRGSPPSATDTAEALAIAERDSIEAYKRLAEGHVIVLEPGSTDIWMANPLSARPTGFEVTTSDGRRFFGNCSWDAPGILAMLVADGRVVTSCPDCEQSLELVVEDGNMHGPADAVGHFLVPARQWWEDIGFT